MTLFGLKNLDFLEFRVQSMYFFEKWCFYLRMPFHAIAYLVLTHSAGLPAPFLFQLPFTLHILKAITLTLLYTKRVIFAVGNLAVANNGSTNITLFSVFRFTAVPYIYPSCQFNLNANSEPPPSKTPS